MRPNHVTRFCCFSEVGGFLSLGSTKVIMGCSSAFGGKSVLFSDNMLPSLTIVICVYVCHHIMLFTINIYDFYLKKDKYGPNDKA